VKSPRISRSGGLAIATVAVAALVYAGTRLPGTAPPPVAPPIAAPMPPDEAAPLLQPQADAGSPPLPSPLEKDQTVKTPEPQKRRPTGRDVLKTGCLIALTGLDGGCATVPSRPPRDECPPKVVEAMLALGFPEVPDDQRIREVLVHINWGKDSLWQPGPIVGRVMKPHVREGKTVFPEGTLLHGHLYIWPRPDPQKPLAMRVHYTEAQLPTGKKVPVCLAQVPTNDCAPKDGAFDCQLPHITNLTAVPRWDDEGYR